MEKIPNGSQTGLVAPRHLQQCVVVKLPRFQSNLRQSHRRLGSLLISDFHSLAPPSPWARSAGHRRDRTPFEITLGALTACMMHDEVALLTTCRNGTRMLEVKAWPSLAATLARLLRFIVKLIISPMVLTNTAFFCTFCFSSTQPSFISGSVNDHRHHNH